MIILLKKSTCYWVLIISAILLLITACNQKATETVIETTTEITIEVDHSKTGITVQDFWERTVHLAKPAQRIVALSPHIVENLYSAGLGDKIVATVDYADYPIVANQIPRIGGFSNFSIEAIIQYAPDLVVGWGSGYAGFGELIKKLSQLGITVYVDDPKNLKDITHSITDLATLGGNRSAALVVQERFNKRLNELTTRYASTKGQRLRLFYPVWYEPLQTLNGEHLVNDAITLCGANNLFEDALTLAPKVNMESVLARDPEVIVASASAGERPEWLEKFKHWPQITAVRNGDLYAISGDLLSRHTLRILEGVELLCHYVESARVKLYPDATLKAGAMMNGDIEQRL